MEAKGGDGSAWESDLVRPQERTRGPGGWYLHTSLTLSIMCFPSVIVRP